MSATLYINGEWQAAASTFTVRNPATVEPIAQCANGDAAAATAAVDAAAAAFPRWAATSPDERARLLNGLAGLLERDATAISRVLVAESGKPRADAAREVASSAAYLRWNAEEGRRCYGRVEPASHSGAWLCTLRQPVGVVCAITPWNYPLNTLCRKLAPALAAGCTVVIKPAPETPLSAVELARRAQEAGVPAGVLNLVTTQNAAEVAGAWLADARVRKVAFTGSTEVGKKLFRASADTLKRVSLELGGHAPALVFADADLEQAAAAIVASRFRHAGQTCICAQRVLVEESAAGKFLDALRERVSALKVGNGEDEGVDYGPLIHEQALARVVAHVNDAVAQGASVAAGGAQVRLPDPNRGCFFQPTLLDRVHSGMRVMREETFGPVLPVMRFSGEQEAIATANATQYGLAAYAFTRDMGRALRLAEALDFGTVGINTTAIVWPGLPFGGRKLSGHGKENGPEGVEEYLEVKAAVFGTAS